MIFNDMVATLAERCARHPWRVFLLVIVISGFSIWGTVLLPVYTSRQALLPKDKPVSQRLQSFLDKFGSASDLIIALENTSGPDLERFASELAVKLRQLPTVDRVNEHLEIQFFLQHAYLLIPSMRLDEFSEVMDILEGMKVPPEKPGLDEGLERVQTWLANPPPFTDMNVNIKAAEEGIDLLTFFFEEWQRWVDSPTAPTSINWERLLARHGAESLAKGYYTSHDGKMLFIFVHPKNPSEEYKILAPFIEQVRTTSEQLAKDFAAKSSDHSTPTIGFTGLPAVVYEEYTAIKHDITLVIITAGILVVLLILITVRSLRWSMAIFIPMGLGVLWSTGLTIATIGHLTIITSGFTAILFGLGVDYGIFTSSRIAEERLKGVPLIQAIGSGIGSASRAVLTAGGATVLVFGALMTVDFPGFSELGLVAGTGVLLVLICTFIVQPAIYALLPPPLKPPKRNTSLEALPRTSRALTRPVALVMVLLAMGVAVAGAIAATSIPFDYDVLSLLPKNSEAAYYQRRMVAESDYQGEVVIFTAPDIDRARDITNQASTLKTIARVQTITNLFPPDAEKLSEKARQIGTTIARSAYVKKTNELDRVGIPEKTFELLRSVLSKGLDIISDGQEQAFSAGHKTLVNSIESLRAVMDKLSQRFEGDPVHGRERSEKFMHTLLEAAQDGLKVLEGWQDAKPLTPDQLPTSLRDRFFAADGTVAIYAFPAQSVYNPDNLDRLMEDVYRVSKDATGFPTTHKEFSHLVVESFKKGSVLALAVCLLWILLLLRSIRGFLISALPLLLGGGLMLGILALMGIKYNYANIIALPLVIGLAVDYGVWFGHRRRELQDISPIQVAMVAGKAILLAAGTTLAGLGAICLASYRGVSSMGIAITIGLLCCLFAALVFSPPIAQLLFRRKP